MPKRLRIPLIAVTVLFASAPLAAQSEAALAPAGEVSASRASGGAANPLLDPSASFTPQAAVDQRWMQPFEDERARAEVNRPRWLFPAAGAVIGGVVGVGLAGNVSRSDYMGPISPYYVLVPLGALAGGLVGWYLDAAQRQWIATRPEREER